MLERVAVSAHSALSKIQKLRHDISLFGARKE